MRRSFRLSWAIFWGLVLAVFPAHATVEQQYLQIYGKLNEAERLSRADDFKTSLADFEACFQMLKRIREDNPDWESALVQSRLEDARAKIYELQVKANIPRTTLAIGPIKPIITYPWKTNIATKTFWIGEKSAAKGWDLNWIRDNDGADNPDQMSAQSGYSSLTHASTLNPFYVALPFNDLTYPKLARKWMPASWARPPGDVKPTSACKDRWIEIKNPASRVCYAQWEVAGPSPANDAAYVFGSKNARSRTHYGLEISPAVAKYLGASSAVTSWRFVDDADVRPGMWLRYDEQAILFRAMHQSTKTAKPASPAH